MAKVKKILKYLLIFLSIVLIASCAPARKSSHYQKKKKASHVNTEQLGRNKYYFSQQYQKKLGSTYRKKKR
ncbi:MAG TPA: hypothetical protein VHO50_10095 [Bacteroidales bacterium]|nr:hypothetical protein [Bacteroidales bacterium]